MNGHRSNMKVSIQKYKYKYKYKKYYLIEIMNVDYIANLKFKGKVNGERLEENWKKA